MKTVLYARVSTRDQKPGNQLRELRKYAKQRGFDVVAEQVDKESGAKADRPALAQVMEMARKREVDAVLVWKFDRFARSTRQLVNALEEFKGLGVDFISYTENVDTSTPAGKALFTKKCKICHGAEGQGNPGMAKVLKVEIKHLGDASVQGKTDDDIKKAVTEGFGKMKPVKGVAGGDLDNVLAFVRTLKK